MQITRTRLSSYERTGINNEVTVILNQHVNNTPFPCVKNTLQELALYLIDDPEYTAWVHQGEVISKRHGCVLPVSRYVKIHIEGSEHALVLSGIDTHMHLPQRGRNDDYFWLSSTHPAYVSVLSWANSVAQHIVARQDAFEFFRGVISKCKTPGQIKRALPDLVPLLPAHMQQSVFKQKRSSTWPNVDVGEIMSTRDRYCIFLASCMLRKQVSNEPSVNNLVTIAAA